jgi:cytochrome c553
VARLVAASASTSAAARGSIVVPQWVAALVLVAGLALAAAPPARAAPFEDTIGQRVLACTGCHGAAGRAAADGYYPRIAGKPAGYLYNQLLHFRDGRRDYALMTHLVAPLTDAYLREIAVHFASLDLPYPPPAVSSLPPGMAALGERLVRDGDPGRGIPSCNACHGAAMTGVAPTIPGLLGLPRDYLNAQLGAWRAGKRSAHPPDCMAQVARSMSFDDIAAVSSWLAAQRVPSDARPATGLPTRLPLACGGIARARAPRGPATAGAAARR